MKLRNTAREPLFTARYSIDLVVHQNMGGRWMIRMPGNQLQGPFTSCLDAESAVVRGPTAARIQPLHEQKLQAN